MNYGFRFFHLRYFAPDDGAGAGGGGNADPNANTGDKPEGGEGSSKSEDEGGDEGGEGSSSGGGEKRFTQAEVDKLVGKARTQERNKAADAAKKAQMDEVERLKTEASEKDERDKKRQARLIRAEAKSIAQTLGVKPERLDYALQAVDLSQIELDDDDDPDTAQIKEALQKLLEAVPELKGTPGAPKGGSEFDQGGKSKEELTEEKIQAMTPEEMAKNMDAIKEFYRRKRQKS
jgi:hypothetical protein